MNSEYSKLSSEESESDFLRLVQDIQTNRVPAEVLFESKIFKRRLRLITMASARTAQDAEELANDVRVEVWQKIQHFKLNPSYPYGGFFSWLRMLTGHIFLDTLRRRRKVEFYEQQVQSLDVADTQMDIESSFLYKEVMAEFEKSIHALPEKERLAIAYYLQGFTLRETSEKMRQAGFSSSHVTVRKWIRDALTAFFPESSDHPNIKSRNLRVTKVRATRAKKEFYTILEHAINSGTAEVVPEKTYRGPVVPATNRKTSKTAKPISRPGWQSAIDLMKRMQSPESKQGIQAAFDASSAQLGSAAIEQANNGRPVAVSFLTTSLMAASTANVLGRVMNLSKDAA